MVEEKEQIILLDSHKIFLSLDFLKDEEEECLTAYGKGLLNGLLDPGTFHKMPVVPKKYYDKFNTKYNDLLLRHSLLKERPSKIDKLKLEIKNLKTNSTKMKKQLKDKEEVRDKKWYQR